MPYPGQPLAGYGAAIVEEAYTHLGRKEIGSNAGTYVRALLSYVGIERPSPWCTAVAVNILHKAADRLGARPTCPRAASGAKLWRWAMRHPDLCQLITHYQDLLPGDVVISGATAGKTRRIRAGKLASGHTWIAASKATPQTGHHATLEGNTSMAGLREGQGFYARTRVFNDIRTVGAIRFEALWCC